MNYIEIIEEYKTKNQPRLLLMNLCGKKSIFRLYDEMRNQNVILPTCSVKEIFDGMKGWIETEEFVRRSKRSVSIIEKKVHCNISSRDCAAEFAFRILNDEITLDDKPYLYNTALYILTHSRVFTNNIRYHVLDLISRENLLSKKQMDRLIKDEAEYGGTHADEECDYDTEEDDEYDDEKCNDKYNDEYGGWNSD